MNFIASSEREDDQDWHNYQEQPQPYYESLTGLLLQSGSSPTYFDDDESYKYHPTYGQVEDTHGAGRENDDDGRRHPLSSRLFRKLSFCATYDSPLFVVLGLCGIFGLGSLLGLLLPFSSHGTSEITTSQNIDWDTISNILGCSYFLSWTLSFYPQIITNYRNPRGAKEGVSFDFLVWNMIGFACYAAYVTSFLYSVEVRQEYADRFGSPSHPIIAASGGVNEMEAGGLFRCAGQDEGNVGFVGKLMPRNMISMPITATLTERVSLLCMFLARHHHSWIGYYNDDEKYINNFPNDERGYNNNSSNSTNSSNNKASNATATPQYDTKDDAIVVPQVKFNDVAFAWHALILSIVTFVQIVWISKSNDDFSTNDKNNSIIECSVRRDSPTNGAWVELEHHIESSADLTVLTAAVNSESHVLLNDHHLRNQQHTQPIHKQLDSLYRSKHTQKYQLRNQNISCATKCLILILLSFCVVGVFMILCWSKWQWIDYLYFLSFVKVCVSIVKYIPQVILNYQRKSTSGWQIWNILLDFLGGSLSIVQLIGDSLAEAKGQGMKHGWTGIVGNPAKLGLGLVSIFFDMIFIIQHYILYPHTPLNRNENAALDCPGTPAEIADHVTPLLSESEPFMFASL